MNMLFLLFRLVRRVGVRHAVADTDLGEYVFRFGGILFDLPADIRHVDAQDLVAAARGGPPQLAQDKVIGEDLSGMAGEQ